MSQYGQTRWREGAYEAFMPPGEWVCAEAIVNAPEGMCAHPVDDATRCPIHHPTLLAQVLAERFPRPGEVERERDHSNRRRRRGA